MEARDKQATARFLTEVLGLAPPRTLAHFTVVQVGETSLDFLDTDGAISSRHFAFLVSEAEFDQIFARIEARGIPYWADPFHPEPTAITRWDARRGPSFDTTHRHPP